MIVSGTFTVSTILILFAAGFSPAGTPRGR